MIRVVKGILRALITAHVEIQLLELFIVEGPSEVTLFGFGCLIPICKY